MAEKKTKEKILDLKASLVPRATEKTYFEQTRRTYAFFVKPSASKQEIANQVSDQFNVTVEDVRTLVRKGKKTKYSKGKHAYPGTTFRRDHKLAYVTLAEGNSIRVFEESEEKKEEKPAKKAEKKVSAKEAKSADKKADKEKK
ncbi:50S ribosomal protein L23 [Candidatus Saccharibacteria bacterium]|nr:50S ribosomal protein L23 [Candidatus Saccharibacteria bacterium]